MKPIYPIEKVVLAFPPLDSPKNIYENLSLTPPMGLQTLKSYAELYHPEIPITILDGMFEGKEKLEEKIMKELAPRTLLGLTTTSGNTENVFYFAELAKQKNATVALGGPHATLFYKQILTNRPYVDLCVLGDGDNAIKAILDKSDNIPNIAYKNGGINTTRYIPTDFWNMPIIKRDKKMIERYFESLERLKASGIISHYKQFKRPTSTFTHKGCSWRDRTNGGCVFCSSLNGYDKYRQRNPEIIWKEAEYLHKEFGIDFILDHSEYLTSDWLKKFHDSRPNESKVAFSFFTRATEVTEEFAKYLKDINCYEIRLGIESGNNSILKNTRKGSSVQKNLEAVKILKDYGINAIVGLVYGLPGETKQSLEDSLYHAKILYENGNVKAIYGSSLVPFPGSVAFKMLVRRKKYDLDRDYFNLRELEDSWLKEFTSVTHNDIENIQQQVGKLTNINNPMPMVVTLGIGIV